MAEASNNRETVEFNSDQKNIKILQNIAIGSTLLQVFLVAAYNIIYFKDQKLTQEAWCVALLISSMILKVLTDSYLFFVIIRCMRELFTGKRMRR